MTSNKYIFFTLNTKVLKVEFHKAFLSDYYLESCNPQSFLLVQAPFIIYTYVDIVTCTPYGYSDHDFCDDCTVFKLTLVLKYLFQKVFHGELFEESLVLFAFLFLLNPLLFLTKFGHSSGLVRQLQLRDQVVLHLLESGPATSSEIWNKEK